MLLLHMQIRRYFNKICDNIQDHCVLYDNAVRLVTCEGWHHFTKSGDFGHVRLV